MSKLISFYRYIYFNAPQTTRLAGLALILAVGAIHLIEGPGYLEAPAYLGVLFFANALCSLIAASGILRGTKSWGWALASAISGLSALAYVYSRLFGLPGYPETMGAWDTPLGSVAVIVELLFVGLYFSIITGMNVTAPDRRSWHD